jgi:hypothetical protein
MKEDYTAAKRREGTTMTAWICRQAAKNLADVLAHCGRLDSESRPQLIFGIAVRPSLML